MRAMSGLLRMMRRQTQSTVHGRMNALLSLDDGLAVERSRLVIHAGRFAVTPAYNAGQAASR
jgi:hypothetical protein